MERLAPQQRLQIVQLYYGNQRSVRNVFRALRLFYGRHNRPTEPTIRNTIGNIETQFSLLDNTRPNRPYLSTFGKIKRCDHAPTSYEDNDNNNSDFYEPISCF